MNYFDEIVSSYYDLSDIKNGCIKKKTTFRINNLKTTNEEIESVLKDNNIEYEKVSFFKDAYILLNENEEVLRNLPIYEEGKIYIQSISSMIPPIVLNPKSGESILDMAAAPGGKTSEIASITNDECLITAVEKNKIRGEKLKYNLEKQGLKHISVLFEDATKLNEFMKFNKVLLDAPCSGSGTLVSEEEINNFSKELVDRSVAIQKQLLIKALSLVNKNDEIVYSTCSILKCENEDLLKDLIDKQLIEIIPIELDIEDTLPSTIEGVLTIKPSNLYEGFFVSKFKKL